MISKEQYEYAAGLLKCEVAALRAVQKVESSTIGGFLPTGLPVILFEGHVFWKYLKQFKMNPEDFVKGNEDILYKSWTKKYYKGGSAEWQRLYRAIQIHREAALMSASWGMFQIMGFNYKTCNCKNVFSFVDKMSMNEYQQLILFVYFIKSNENTLKFIKVLKN